MIYCEDRGEAEQDRTEYTMSSGFGPLQSISCNECHSVDRRYVAWRNERPIPEVSASAYVNSYIHDGPGPQMQPRFEPQALYFFLDFCCPTGQTWPFFVCSWFTLHSATCFFHPPLLMPNKRRIVPITFLPYPRRALRSFYFSSRSLCSSSSSPLWHTMS